MLRMAGNIAAGIVGGMGPMAFNERLSGAGLGGAKQLQIAQVALAQARAIVEQNDADKAVQESAERTLVSLATMLGWGNLPPRETLEREISELKHRARVVCICAAIRTMEGEIVRGHRHDSCMRQAEAMRLTYSDNPLDQGFITSDNRYVTRQEGAAIMRAAGWISATTKQPFIGDVLFSEDLYLREHTADGIS